MSPPFIFRIDEFSEHPNAPENFDAQGKWLPMTVAGYNVRIRGGVSGKWWFCNKTNIQEMSNWTPNGTSPYKTFSTFFGSGHGFWVLRGDATNPPNDECWHHLRFDHHPIDYSSSLSNAGQQAALRCQGSSAWWPHMLLPCIYHGPPYDYQGYGGLTGDLPIFLSLLALSMRPEMLAQGLPSLMQNGDWTTHQNAHGRTDKRGVIVYVYAVENNSAELSAYEDGHFGKYYN